jgi:hypothetical protein
MVREARFSCDADAGFQAPDLRDRWDDFDDPLFDEPPLRSRSQSSERPSTQRRRRLARRKRRAKSTNPEQRSS